MKLYGVKLSNYYNIAKLALLEKGIPFEEVLVIPGDQGEAFRRKSPMGKIPVLETEQGFISESKAIIRYLEAYQPNPPLIPNDPFAAAQAEQIHQIIDLYVDAPARTLLPAAFFGKSATQEEIQAVTDKLDKSMVAVSIAASFDPYIAGDTFTHADLAAILTLKLASEIMLTLKAPDPLRHIPAYAEYLVRMKQRPAVKQVMAERDEAAAQFFAQKQ